MLEFFAPERHTAIFLVSVVAIVPLAVYMGRATDVLLVFGLAAFVGGLKHPVQHFNRTAAGPGATMLLLSAVGLTVPGTRWMLQSA
jgi:Ca2+/H+ antiporter